MPSRLSRAVMVVCALVFLAACAAERQAPQVPRRDVDDARRREQFGTLFGPDALTFSTNPDRDQPGAGGVGIGVNAFLWRASLQTLDFIPLASADPFGGVIITEWYRPPETEGERFKLNVYITDTQLRADAVDVSVFREVRDGAGEWRDAPVDAQTSVDLENTILTRARELRIAAG